MDGEGDGTSDDPTIVDPDLESDADDTPSGDPLKDTQRQLHRVTTENAKLREQVAKLAGQTETLLTLQRKPEEQVPEAEPFDIKDEEAATLIEDPKVLVTKVRETIKGERKLIGDVLGIMREDILTEIRKMLPRDEGREAILAEMRKDPDLKDIKDDNVLLLLAKKMGRPTPRGGPSGRRTAGSSPGASEAAKAMYQRIYGRKMEETQ